MPAADGGPREAAPDTLELGATRGVPAPRESCVPRGAATHSGTCTDQDNLHQDSGCEENAAGGRLR